MADYANVYAGYQDDPTASGPTGIPDPNRPGYDTAGYPLNTSSAPQTEYPGGTQDDPNTQPVPRPAPPPVDPGAPVPRDAHQTGSAAPPVPTGATGEGGDTLGGGGGAAGGILAPFSEAAPVFNQQPAFTPQTFKAPSIGEAFDDPSYQWQRDETLSGLNRWAAYKGTLNDSGTARAFLDLGNNIANQRLGDVWSRAFTEYQGNEGALERAYGMNRQSQYIDPYTAMFNSWRARAQDYLQNQGTAANAYLGFGNLVK
jgi:hypothetical protein